jgi:hypothetical protein
VEDVEGSDRQMQQSRGEYYGPSGRSQYTGYPTRLKSSAGSHDAVARRRLWETSERLTGVSYRIFAPSDQRVETEDA